MTDKLRAAAEMALENFQNLASHWNHYAANMDMKRIDFDAIAGARKSLEALRQALDQLPAATEMIEPSVGIVGWMYEDQLPEIYPYEEMFQFSVVDGVRMFPVYAPKSEPDMGTDRGAWDDVPDATKWVDELRGEDDELPPVKTYCGGKPNYCQPEELPKREWQSLTDYEIYPMYCEPRSDAEMIAFARELEAKLKEKNGF